MDYNKIIEVNGKIIDKALPKIEKAMLPKLEKRSK